MTSGFHRSANEICTLLGFYAAYNGSLLPMLRDKLSVRPQGLSRNYHSVLRKIPKERRSSVSILDWYAVCVCVSGFIIWTSGMNYAPLNANAVHFKFLQTVLITWRSRERVKLKNTIVSDFMIMKWCTVIDLKKYSFRLGNIFVECKITRRALV
jgi:hypothetical protein